VADAIKRWMDANGPSAEHVDELRQFQGAQLDGYQAKLAPHLMQPLRPTRPRPLASLKASGARPKPAESTRARWCCGVWSKPSGCA
jgi:hypothetical protein